MLWHRIFERGINAKSITEKPHAAAIARWGPVKLVRVQKGYFIGWPPKFLGMGQPGGQFRLSVEGWIKCFSGDGLFESQFTQILHRLLAAHRIQAEAIEEMDARRTAELGGSPG